MIHAPRGWSHGSHLGQRSSNECEIDQGPHIAPEKAGKSAISEALAVREEENFPCRHHDADEADGRDLAEVPS